MTIHELETALTISKRLCRLEYRLYDLRVTGGVGAVTANAPVKGGDKSSAEEIVAELDNEIAELKTSLHDHQVIIRHEILKLKLSDDESKIMILRYVKCWCWKLIEGAIGYSKRQTMRIHANARNKALNGTTCHL